MRICGGMIPGFYRPPANVLFPYVHIVSDDSPLHVKHLYDVPSVVKFKTDLDFLCKQYAPLHLSRLPEIPLRRTSREAVQSFVLSFDDGMREVYDVIAPILRVKGIPAIFFLNSSTVDNKQLMWRHKVSLLIERLKQSPKRLPRELRVLPGETVRAKLGALRAADEHILDGIARTLEVDFEEYLRTSKPYLTKAHVLELARDGFEFGAHSDSHPLFCEMTPEEQREEISRSVNFIRTLGLPCRCFAFPFNDKGVGASLFEYMQALELRLSFGTSEARLDSVAFSFQRVALDGENSQTHLSAILKELSAMSLLRYLSRTELIRRN